jgi:ribose-phosphate pyrophosphokinase
MQIVTLPGNPDFNQSLKTYLTDHYDDASFVPLNAKTFASGEVYAQIVENVRGGKIFLVQSSSGSFGQPFAPLSIEIAQKSAAIASGMKLLFAHTDENVRNAAATALFGLTGVELNNGLREDAFSTFLSRQSRRSVNDDFMQLLVTLDALVRTDADSIRYVGPMVPYMRQDRKSPPREPISARLMADLIEKAGADRLRGIMTSELHVPQAQGFFSKPVDNLPMTYLYAADFLATMKMDGIDPNDCIVISPDLGGEKRAEGVGEIIGSDIAEFKKNRVANQRVKNILLSPHGSDSFAIDGRVAIIIDDIVDSGNTLNEAANTLKSLGARKVIAYVAHGVLTEKSVATLSSDGVDVLTVTNTLPIHTLAADQADG